VLSEQRKVDSINRSVELIVVLFGQYNMDNIRLGTLQVQVVSELPKGLEEKDTPNRLPNLRCVYVIAEQ